MSKTIVQEIRIEKINYKTKHKQKECGMQTDIFEQNKT